MPFLYLVHMIDARRGNKRQHFLLMRTLRGTGLRATYVHTRYIRTHSGTRQAKLCMYSTRRLARKQNQRVFGLRIRIRISFDTCLLRGYVAVVSCVPIFGQKKCAAIRLPVLVKKKMYSAKSKINPRGLPFFLLPSIR